MKHLHVANTNKFIEPYINFINSNFDMKNHQFLCFTSKKATNHINNSYENAQLQGEIIGNIKLLKELYAANRIYLHSLFSIKIVILLFFQPWLLKKCYWIIWGGDLYVYREPRTTVVARVKEYARAFVIKRMGNIVSLVKGDYELAKDWYGTRGTYHYGEYVGPISKSQLDALPIKLKSKESPIVIQIGNSADPSNNHIDTLKKLLRFRDENIQIYVPLSYGDERYAKKVIEEGTNLFGEKFISLTEFLPPEEYSAFLNNIDIAIFNNDRQQALGNISALLYLNKKVYIRSDTSMWLDFKERSISLNDFLLVEQLNFTEFIQENENQYDLVNILFDEKRIINIWEKIFK